MKALFLVLLLAFPMQAFSANWTLLSANDEEELEIDAASVRDKKAAWFNHTYTTPQKLSCGFGKEVKSTRFFVEANCKEFTIRTKQSIAYATDGMKVVTDCTFNNTKGEFSEYAPDTMGEILFKAICNAKARVENQSAKSVRLNKALNAFVRKEPCPSSGEASARCDGYTIHYVIPPCASGADAAENYKWVEDKDLTQYVLQQQRDWRCK